MVAQQGIVVAKTHPGNGLTCVAVLDTGTGQLVRPLPSARIADGHLPFWNMPTVRSIAVGQYVHYVASSAAPSTRFPHKSEDLPCTSLALVSPAMLEPNLYKRILPLAKDSINNVWPDEVWSSARQVRADEEVPSFVVVHGYIMRMYTTDLYKGTTLRADIDLTGRILTNVPVTSAALRDSPMSHQGVANKFGLLILGLARPYDPHRDTRSDNEQCAVLLIGWQPEPEQKQVWCESQAVLTSIFLLKDRHAIQLVHDVLGDCDYSTHVQEILWYPENGCIVVALPASPCHQGQLQVCIIEPTSFKCWKRGKGAESLLSSGLVASDQWNRFKDLMRKEAHKDQTPRPVIKALQESLKVQQDAPTCLQALASGVATAQADAFPPEVRSACSAGRKHGQCPGPPLSNAWCRSPYWSCLKAVMHFILTRLSDHVHPETLYKQLVAEYLLWLLERQVELLTPSTATPERINIVMDMFTKVGHKIAKLLEHGVLSNDFEKRCAAVRSLIDSIASARARDCAAQFVLNELSEMRVVDPSIVPCLAGLDRESSTSTPARARIRAIKNLQELPLLPGAQDCAEVLHWAHALGSTTTLHQQLILSCIEKFMFSFAPNLEALPVDEVRKLEAVVDLYLEVSTKYENGELIEQKVEQRSKRLLVAWVAYCLIYATAEENYGFMDEFGVGLHAQDLQRVVLPEKSAVDAALAVHEFLQDREGDPIFSLREGEESCTYHFAAICCKSIATLNTIHEDEESDAETRVKAHWMEVQRKQALAAQLRAEIEVLEARATSLPEEISEVIECTKEFQEHQETARSYQLTLDHGSHLIYESRHFYLDNTNEYEHVKISGARSLTLVFAEECKTEARYDYLELGKDRDMINRLGRFTGKDFPSPEEPFEIQGDSFWYHWFTDGSGTDWGWKFEVSADICEASLKSSIKRHKRQACNLETRLASRPARESLETQLTYVKSQLSRKKKELKEAETTPKAVFQPLPHDAERSRAVVFFVHMPDLFRSLSRMTFLAQQLTLPWPWKCKEQCDVAEYCSVKDYKHQWASHYNEMQTFNREYCMPAKSRTGCDGSVMLLSNGPIPKERTVAGSHIDDLQSPAAGVWYPDTLPLSMAWKSDGLKVGRGCLFNPFAPVPDEWVSHSFSATLPPYANRLQWAMPIGNNVPLTRGNQAIASQSDRANLVDNDGHAWLTKRQFLAFGSLRAVPNQQFRKLCVALHDKLLPWTQPAVRTLVRQCLYHVGYIDASSLPAWKTDLYKGNGFAAVTQALTGLAEEHLQKPRDHQAILVLGDIAAYISQWHSDAEDISRRLAAATTEWAAALNDQIVAAAVEDQNALKAKQGIFSTYTVSCFSAMKLTTDDACNLVTAMVRVQNCLALGAKKTTLHVMCEYVMSCRIGEVLEIVHGKPSICSQAMSVAFEHTPLDLKWSAEQNSTCFHATCKSGRLHSINLLTGVVLLDGYPPRRLPSSVTESPLFKRTFGDIVFEISMESSNKFRSARAVDCCFYEFAVDGDENLRVYEEMQGSRLELIPHDMCRQSLPVRLVELHSHWLDRTSNMLLLRPIHFRRKEISFIIKMSTGECLQIPDHLQGNPRSDLISDKCQKHVVRRLVMHKSKALKVLSKFEDPKYIHVFIRAARRKSGKNDESLPGSSSQIWQFDLPRYQLSFELQDSCLVSVDYHAYRLSDCQQLDITLPEFHQYLVLERVNQDDVSLPKSKVIVPDGLVRPGRPVVIDGDTSVGAMRKSFAYNVHERFGHLQAESIASRLQLAALYAATSSMLPERQCGISGVEMAMQLVRECWVNRPLDLSESDKLENLMSLCSRAPALEILCWGLDASSRQLDFLHTDRHLPQPFHPWRHQDLVIAAYMQEAKAAHPNARRLLTIAEEQRTMGMKSSRTPTSREIILVDLKPLPADLLENYVKKQEKVLCDFTMGNSFNKRPKVPAFPLDEQVFKTTLGVDMLKELRESWDAHHSAKANAVQLKPGMEDPDAYARMLREVTEKRSAAYDYVLQALNTFPGDRAAGRAGAFRVRRLAYIVPRVCIFDVVQMAWRSGLVEILNPFLSEAACKHCRDGVLFFLQLCVLEDRLRRLLQHAQQKSIPMLLQNLQTFRTWDVRKHPKWLVFEVESCLQIRPVQYVVAAKLMQEPGAVVQLNMGEGKTRVIVPMLILEWGTGSDLLRVGTLSALIDEMYGFLHRHLCASLLGQKIYLLPFHRDVEITRSGLVAMRDSIDHCRKTGGAVLLAVEHRLSLYLKSHELRIKGEDTLCTDLERLLQISARDLIDESDEVLHHKYQLIYAVGSPMPLPGGLERWIAAEALLRELHQNESIRQCLDDVAIFEPYKPEAFTSVRLISGEELEKKMPQVSELLLKAVLDNPPYEFPWLERYRDDSSIIEAITDAGKSTESFFEKLDLDKQDFVLALRGLLAYGVFKHCLLKRHRVDYGVNRVGAKKRLAVPFRASDTPSDRSEYGHPDCAIVLTVLSYYLDGLSRSELRCAFQKLLQSGTSAQQTLYDEWFALSSKRMDTEVREMLSTAGQLDLSNEVQFDMLFEHYKKNRETINFWLNQCVFPTETSQFPNKLVANAWHLADNAQRYVNGFSGTNDNHRALPLQVSQKPIPELMGTNGKMMNLILHNRGYSTIGSDGPIQWSTVLDEVLKLDAAALIDCGALTAGATNRQVGQYVIASPRATKFPGVVFFDTDMREWMILDRNGRCSPKHSSSLQEGVCFAFFDESRCRGADLKLKQDAMAAVTVGPGCCKDKLMQAAGRMRQLDKGQKLHFLSTTEVRQKIVSVTSSPKKQDGEVGTQHLLSWVMDNSVKAAEHALPEWSRQGALFSSTKFVPSQALLDETLDLDAFYAQPLGLQPVPDIIRRDVDAYKKRVGELPQNMQEFCNGILQRAGHYGCGLSAVASTLDEEYERELEKEKEVEKEVEQQIPRQLPACEALWDFRSAFNADCIEEVKTTTMGISSILEKTRSIRSKVKWSSKVFCTQNFADTISRTVSMDDFLRPVGPCLIFAKSGQWLLLADHEADALLSIFWEKGLFKKNDASVWFVDFPLARAAFEAGQSTPSFILPRMELGASLPTASPIQDVDILVALQVFMGETMYPTQQQEEALRKWLCVDGDAKRKQLRQVVAKGLVPLRGMLDFFSRSDLARLLLL